MQKLIIYLSYYVFIVISYTCTLLIFGISASNLYHIHGLTLIEQIYDNKSITLLQKIHGDHFYCPDCIQMHSSYEKIESIILSKNAAIIQQKYITYFKIVLNFFGLLNTILINVIYGAPFIIILTTTTTAIIMLIVSFLDNVLCIFILEVSLSVFSWAIAMTSGYHVIKAMLKIASNKSKID